MPALLSATHIGKLYGLRPVLRSVSLQAGQAEFIALLGANGAGKTTLLRILATLMRPDSGTLIIGDVDALAQPEKARARIGLVSHASLIYPDLSAQENLLFYGQMHGIEQDDLELRVEESLRRVNLWLRRGDLARTFSRGMLQRLTIARALLPDPPLLLLDEPFTGLDQSSAASLSSLLRDLVRHGHTAIMATHELERGLEGITRAVILKGGQVSEELYEDLTPSRLAARMRDASSNHAPGS
jgi:ABC-type multidrug transport system ATPase subunit